jgi:diaminopimelate decarboxylase
MSLMPFDLNPMIWPKSALRRSSGEIEIATNGVSELAQNFQTPLYVYDADEILLRANQIKAAFDSQSISCDVHYASKAFLSKAVARIIDSAKLHLDVASGGELAIALAAGFKAERVAFHGNNKSDAELEFAISNGVGHIVIDSLSEIDQVAQIAAKHQKLQAVMLRATLGIDANTHEYISTAHEDQKFGLSVMDGSLISAVEKLVQFKSLNLIGLHSHIGSQILAIAGFAAAAEKLVEQTANLNRKFNLNMSTLGLGGGFGIAYVDEDKPVAIEEIAKLLNETVLASSKKYGLAVTKITVEPGRFIVGPPGITLYTVGTVKPVTTASGSTRHYVSVDGGMSDNIRTALYDAKYSAVLANRKSDAELVLSRIVGKHCESGDIVVRDCLLPADIKPGDLVAVAATGAYCRSMASQYNGTPRPAVVGISSGTAATWIRRETYEDLLALDLG